MAQTSSGNQRLQIPYFEGVNSTVQHVIAKTTELYHSENARSKTIGTLEKREGQQKVGTAAGGGVFTTTGNYGLTKFINDGANQGVFRISTTDTSPTPSASTSTSGGTLAFFIVENIVVWEPTILPTLV